MGTPTQHTLFSGTNRAVDFPHNAFLSLEGIHPKWWDPDSTMPTMPDPDASDQRTPPAHYRVEYNIKKKQWMARFKDQSLGFFSTRKEGVDESWDHFKKEKIKVAPKISKRTGFSIEDICNAVHEDPRLLPILQTTYLDAPDLPDYTWGPPPGYILERENGAALQDGEKIDHLRRKVWVWKKEAPIGVRYQRIGTSILDNYEIAHAAAWRDYVQHSQEAMEARKFLVNQGIEVSEVDTCYHRLLRSQGAITQEDINLVWAWRYNPILSAFTRYESMRAMNILDIIGEHLPKTQLRPLVKALVGFNRSDMRVDESLERMKAAFYPLLNNEFDVRMLTGWYGNQAMALTDEEFARLTSYTLWLDKDLDLGLAERENGSTLSAVSAKNKHRRPLLYIKRNLSKEAEVILGRDKIIEYANFWRDEEKLPAEPSSSVEKGGVAGSVKGSSGSTPMPSSEVIANQIERALHEHLAARTEQKREGVRFAQSLEELQEEYRAWVEGEKDDHDRVVDAFKAKSPQYQEYLERRHDELKEYERLLQEQMRENGVEVEKKVEPKPVVKTAQTTGSAMLTGAQLAGANRFNALLSQATRRALTELGVSSEITDSNAFDTGVQVFAPLLLHFACEHFGEALPGAETLQKGAEMAMTATTFQKLTALLGSLGPSLNEIRETATTLQALEAPNKTDPVQETVEYEQKQFVRDTTM